MFICVAMYVCQGKAMLAYTTHLPWKQEENERLRGEGDQIKFIDLTFESCRIQESKKEARQSTNLTLQGRRIKWIRLHICLRQNLPVGNLFMPLQDNHRHMTISSSCKSYI